MSVRVLVVPDSFKGTMTATTVAAALGEGVTSVGGEAIVCPLADGGEGTAEVLHTVLGGDFVEEAVTGPLGNPVVGRYLLTDRGRLAVLDTATASGLHLVRPGRRDAEKAASTGTGELLAAAAAAGVERILLGVGGSACTDGGVGALSAIRARGGLFGAVLTVLCDVQTPFELAAVVYGPQKGADAAAVVRLTERLEQIAELLPRDPRRVPGGGAAGGLSGALWASFGARLVPGIDAILDAVQFDELVSRSDVVITGEGCLDEQTAEGKVVAGVLRRAQAAEVPVWAAVGRSTLSKEQSRAFGLAGVVEAGDPEALRSAGAAITRGADEGTFASAKRRRLDQPARRPNYAPVAPTPRPTCS